MAKEKQSPRWIQAWMGGQSHWTHEFAEGKSFNIPFHPRNSQLDIAPKSEQQGQALAAALKKELDELFLNARSQGHSYRDAAQLIAERGYILSRHDTQRFWEQGQARKDLSPQQKFTLNSLGTPEFDPNVDLTRDYTEDQPAPEFESGYENLEDLQSVHPKQGDPSSLDVAKATAEFYGRGTPPTKLQSQTQFVPARHDRFLDRRAQEELPQNLARLKQTVAEMPSGEQKKAAEAFILETEGHQKSQRDNAPLELEQARSKLSKRYEKQSRVAWWVGDRLLDYARALMIKGGGEQATPDAIDPLLLEGFEDKGLIQAIENPNRQLEASFDRQASAHIYFGRMDQEGTGRFGAVQTGEEKVPSEASSTIEVSTEPLEEQPSPNFKSVADYHDLDPASAELAVIKAKQLIKHGPNKNTEKMLGDWMGFLNKLFRKRFGHDTLKNIGPLQFLKVIHRLAQHYEVDARDFVLTSIPQHKEILARGGRPSTGFDELQQGGRTSLVMEHLEFIKSGRGLTGKSYEELLEDNSIVKIHGSPQAKKKSEFLMRVAGVNAVKQEDLQGLSERTNESLEALQARFLSAQSVGEPLMEVRLKPFDEHLGSALAELIAPGAIKSLLVDKGEDK